MAMTAGFARCWLHQVASAAFAGTPCSNTLHVNQAPFFRQTSTEIVGACARTGVGPYAAWMPRKSLHGRTCGVSYAGTRASALSRSKF
ncbi:hypothetical protein E1J25_03115 [Xanthomonas hortorum pv. taraxaci]|nr:hypothetical protein [Xanthomonas hortorum pv. taraxaci]